MRARVASLLAFCVVLAVSLSSQTQSTELAISRSGPAGELQELSQANEISLVFSEPMVPLGAVPSNPTPDWVRITPAIKGTFRWSGTTMLIFTPGPATPLPYATRYRVTVDATAAGVSGRRLRTPYESSFTTPTAKLTSLRSARRDGRFDSVVTLALRFNQPVRAADVLAHTVVRYISRDFTPPMFSTAERARLLAADPDGVRRFDVKVADARRNASRTDVVPVRIAPDAERPRFADSPNFVVLQTTTPPAPGTALQVVLDARLPSAQGPEVPNVQQSSVSELGPMLFVQSPGCRTECNPSAWHAIGFTTSVPLTQFSQSLSATDVTDTLREQSLARSTPVRAVRTEASQSYSVEDAGFTRQPPARTWAIRLDASMQSEDGQTLGYPWVGIVENWNERAFMSFGDGHGVWESAGGPALPYYSRNFQTIVERVERILPADLIPRLVALEGKQFQVLPGGAGTTRRLAVTPNQVQSYGLDLKGPLGKRPFGIFWAGLEPGTPIAKSRPVPRDTSSLIQVTNLGVTVKDSPQATLVFVTRLDNGEPVGDAKISIVDPSNKTMWRGSTGRDGIAMAPALTLRSAEDWHRLSFVVLAEKDGDVAYTASNWNEGIEPWDFNLPFDLWQATAILRGSIFTDRGVYKPGEPVQIKAIVRLDTPTGVRLLPAGTPLDVTVRDARNKVVDTRTVRVTRWSSVEWNWPVPAGATLGHYAIELAVPNSKPAEGNDVTPHGPNGSWLKQANGGFLVAAYRRPDFEVTARVTASPALAGEALAASVSASYLFGGSMSNRPVAWSLSRAIEPFALPEAVYERFPQDQFVFGYWPDRRGDANDTRIAGESVALDRSGRLSLSLPTDRDTDLPHRYTFEADVEDVSRQHIANRADVLVHPAQFYLGVQRPAEFASASTPVDTRIVAIGIDGIVRAGVSVTVELLRSQWNSVRHAEGGGFYSWQSEQVETRVNQWQVTTAATPVPLSMTVSEGGSYVLRVTARDADGRRTRTDAAFYASGPGYTAWQRYDHNRIDLEPEKRVYKSGETARILIKSPWEHATALLTVEREGIRQHRRFTLTSTQQTVDVPIGVTDIPNVYVSVLLIRGRTSNDVDAEGSDPGRPVFRLGYAELPVADGTKRLTVKVEADQAEYRPANTARVSVAVTDPAGRGARSEVTLWAVDQGVLALTQYNAPDVARAIYVQKALQVMNSDNRQRLISRRVLTPKGADEGGGGGMEGTRTDFRPLAFWLGSVETDRNGRASRSVTLPDTLTTYRIMAVAGDELSRFGATTGRFRVTKPITLVPALPRFLALSDRASLGALLGNTLATDVNAVVTIRSLTPELLEITGNPTASFAMLGGATTVARFDAIARGVGSARIRVSVTAGPNSDAFEASLPVGAPARMETTAAFGDTVATATERLSIPAGVLPAAGGLNVELASSALVGLGEGARYLADYPYGCAEQKASAALALALAADLGAAFSMGRIAPADYRVRAQQLIDDLPKYQCADGGFGYWPGGCRLGNFYLTSYVLHVLKVVDGLGIKGDAQVNRRALDFLANALTAPAPREVQWLPVWNASAAYGVKVLTDYGRNQDGNITRLVASVDQFPVFALSYLADAMASMPVRHPRYADIVRRLSNAVRVEGNRAHVEELNDDYLLWLWNSNVRSTAIVLEGLVRRGDDALVVPSLARGLLLAREDGRWRNTQENAAALSALVAYYRKYESEIPDMTATVAIGPEAVGSARFRGRSSAAELVMLAMPELLTRGAAGAERELTIRRDGTGRLYYAARLQYVPSRPLPVSDLGIRLERRYERLSENGATAAPAATTFAGGDLVRVTLTITLPQERRYVAVSDPLAAGFEAVDSWFSTTASDLARDASRQSGDESWIERWRRGGFDFVEKYDDRVALFATRLSEGRHEFSYVVRATTSGTFTASGTWAEEMYAPEVNGRSAPVTITIR